MAHRTISPVGGTANYELRLCEGQSRFDVIYGAVTQRQHQRNRGSTEKRHRL